MPPLERVQTPCVGLCALDRTTGQCRGCHRTRDEIAVWGGADDALRLEILKRLPPRKRIYEADRERRRQERLAREG